jgi:hypothetical protein
MGHVVQVLPPQSISGGKTGQAFHVKDAEHVSIIIMIGAFGAAKPTSITLNACQNVSGLNATPMPFRYYLSSSGGQTIDTTSPPTITTSGNSYAIPASLLSLINNEFIVIEVDSAEIDYLGDSNGTDYPYLQLVIADSGNTTYMSAVAICSGQRYAYQGGGPSITS